MPKLTALLFDLDGTLADTAAANYDAYSAALAEVGVTVAREDFDALAAGRNWRQFLPGLLAGNTADPAAIAARKQALYASGIENLRLNTPLLSLLIASRASMKTALVTSASAASVAAILTHHALAPLFDAVVTGDDVERHKPDPEAYLLAAARLGVSPADCLAFEDSPIGLASASAAGMATLKIEF